MIPKAVFRVAAPALLVFIAFNAYLAINHLRRLQKSATISLESSLIQSHIAEVLRDFTDMETGQRGYLLTDESDYLKPYINAKNRLGMQFASLRSDYANRNERERELETQLESLARSMQAEIEKTITLRNQGYRHRAFLLVQSNEGKDYMDKARGLVGSLSSMENARFETFERERGANSRKILSQTIIANSGLLVLAAFLCWFIGYNERGLEREAARSKGMLAKCDSKLQQITSVLSNQTRTKITVIDGNARMLLEKYGGFLPQQGYEYVEQIKETVEQMERLRTDLVGPGFSVDQEAA